MEKDTTLFRVNQIIHYIVFTVTGLLSLRFIMQLLGANPNATFTELIYGVTGVFTAPFQFVFSPATFGASTLEWNTLLAILVYWLLGEALIMMIAGLRSVGNSEVQKQLREDYQ